MISDPRPNQLVLVGFLTEIFGALAVICGMIPDRTRQCWILSS